MQLFVPGPQGYQAWPLDGPAALTRGPKPVVPLEAAGGEAVAWVLPHRDPGGLKRAALFTRDRGLLLVNGREPLPMAVLCRGDEIRLGRVSLFFTDEAPLRVVPFDPAPYAGRKEACTRCHRPLVAGEPVVFCPVCDLPYMAQRDKEPNCWSYGPCSGCQRDPRAEFVWRPDAGQVRPRRRASARRVPSGDASAG